MESNNTGTNIPTGVEATPAGNAENLNGPFPSELNTWNWGAFFLTWIWALGNNVWIGLLALISPLTFIMAIILGIKGNEMAWKAKKWESVEHFKKVQAAWAKWGVVIFVLLVAAVVVGFSVAMVTAVKFGSSVQNWDDLSQQNVEIAE